MSQQDGRVNRRGAWVNRVGVSPHDGWMRRVVGSARLVGPYEETRQSVGQFLRWLVRCLNLVLKRQTETVNGASIS